MKVNIYLNFMGNTEEAFSFYKSVFGGEFMSVNRFKDTPEADKLSDADKEKIMHISLPIGNGFVLMGTDAIETMGQKLNMGDNFSISLHPDSKEEADKIFNGLSQGGSVELALQDMFWGAYYGILKDKFGVQWMVNYEYPKA